METEKVEKGIEQEFDRLDQFDCIDITDKDKAYERIKAGKTKFSVTWAHTDRGEEVRSRLCCREFKSMDPNMEGVYTPASNQATSRVIDIIAVKKKQKTQIGDASNAYFHAEETEEIYVQPPAEWLARQRKRHLPDHVMWRMKKQLYGRRKASKAFNEFMVKELTKLGFVQCAPAPHFFRQDEKDMDLELHQDDWHGTGPDESLDWFAEEIRKAVTVKVSEKLGVGAKYQHLKCGRYRVEGGTFITGNNKYAKEIIRCLGLEKANPKDTPIVNSSTVKDEATPKLDEERKKKYGHCVGVARFMVNQRSGCMYATRELSKKLKDPNEADWQRLLRLGRYLVGTLDYAIWLPEDEDMEWLDTRSDTDWAGDVRDRKSTACGCIDIGDCPVFEFTRGQAVHALSSGEAEFYGAASVVAEGIYIQKVFEFFGWTPKLRLWVDPSAAKSMLQRQGVGRVRHLEVKTLWIQSLVERKLLCVRKQQGEKNVADIGTKATPPPTFTFLRHLLGLRKVGDLSNIVEKKTVATVTRSDEDEILGLIKGVVEMIAALCKRRIK